MFPFYQLDKLDTFSSQFDVFGLLASKSPSGSASISAQQLAISRSKTSV